MHRLLERLPELAEADRPGAAEVWLARHGGTFSAEERAAMIARALTVLADPAWTELFSPAALAEVPIAATVGGQVVAGTIDRLLVQPDRVLLVDFKTARRPPASIGDVPQPILRQMAAYVATLETVYPGRAVEAALLYTETPLLIAIPAETIERHKQPLLAMQ
jgi:ATP-dependent helicase/nuclease subunit A